jgi:hypothetical protein
MAVSHIYHSLLPFRFQLVVSGAARWVVVINHHRRAAVLPACLPQEPVG